MTEMARKKMVAAHFLPGSFVSWAIANQISEVEKGKGGRGPLRLSSHSQNWCTKLHLKKKQRSDSSLLRQLLHLDTIDLPLAFAQRYVGVFMWRRHQEKQANREQKNLFQMRPAQGTSAAEDLSRFQADSRKREPVESPCQDRMSGSSLPPIRMCLVD